MLLVLIFVSVALSFKLDGKVFSAKAAFAAEKRSQGFNHFDWTTAQPSEQPNAVIREVVMPSKARVRSLESNSTEEVWPPGTFFSWQQWEALTGSTGSYAAMHKRDLQSPTIWQDKCKDRTNWCSPDCVTEDVLGHQQGYDLVFGKYHSTAAPICGSPGKQTRQYRTSYAWSFAHISGPILPEMWHETLVRLVQQIGIQFGGLDYTWRNAVTTSGLLAILPNARGTVWHRPMVGIAHISAHLALFHSGPDGLFVCSSDAVSHYNAHVPIVNVGQASGIWGTCYIRNTEPCHFERQIPFRTDWFECPKYLE